MADNYAASKQILEAIKVLEAIKEPSARERAALENLRAKAPAATEEVDATGARFRGFVHDATLGQRDTVAGIGSFLGGEGYAKGRDEVREADRAARASHPEAFSSGRAAGSVASMAIPTMGTAKLLKGAGAATKIGTGALLGGAFGANQGIQEAQLDDRTTAADYWDYAKKPGLWGMAIGGGAYPLAAGAGAAVRGARRLQMPGIAGAGRKATNVLGRAADKSAGAGTDIKAYLSSLPPEAMLADVPGAMRTHAKGLASMGGEGAEVLGSAIEKRATGAGQRVKTAADRYIGEADAAFDARRALAKERTHVLGPEYEAAKSHAGPIDAKSITDEIISLRTEKAGDVSAALLKLEKEIGGGAEISATRLHNIRSNLSDEVSALIRAGRGKAATQLKQALDVLDAPLDKVPGYKSARTGWANNKALEESIEEGRKAFTGGATTAMSPRELASKLKGMSEAQRAAYQKGAREWVDALMGTSRNDAAAAWGALGKDWNDTKLRLILGDDAAAAVSKRLKAEKVFSQTRGEVLHGSQTDFRTAARENLSDIRDPLSGQAPSPLKRIKQPFDDAGNAIIDSIVYGKRRSKANLDVGKIMSLQGEARDEAVKDLIARTVDANKTTRKEVWTKLLSEILLKGGGAAVTGQMAVDQ